MGLAERLMLKALFSAAEPTEKQAPAQQLASSSPPPMRGPAEELMMKALFGGVAPDAPAKPPVAAAAAVAAPAPQARSVTPAEDLMRMALMGAVPEASPINAAAATPHAAPPRRPPPPPPPPPAASAGRASGVWPAATPDGVRQVLACTPQLDEPSQATLRGLPPQHALAILWDLDAKGGPGMQSVSNFVVTAARTLLHSRPSSTGTLASPPQSPLAALPLPSTFPAGPQPCQGLPMLQRPPSASMAASMPMTNPGFSMAAPMSMTNPGFLFGALRPLFQPSMFAPQSFAPQSFAWPPPPMGFRLPPPGPHLMQS